MSTMTARSQSGRRTTKAAPTQIAKKTVNILIPLQASATSNRGGLVNSIVVPMAMAGMPKV